MAGSLLGMFCEVYGLESKILQKVQNINCMALKWLICMYIYIVASSLRIIKVQNSSYLCDECIQSVSK